MSARDMKRTPSTQLGRPEEVPAFSEAGTTLSLERAECSFDKPAAGSVASVVYTAADVAGMLRLAEARVYELVRRGMVPAIRVGRQVRIPKRAFDEWLASGGSPLAKAG